MCRHRRISPAQRERQHHRERRQRLQQHRLIGARQHHPGQCRTASADGEDPARRGTPVEVTLSRPNEVDRVVDAITDDAACVVLNTPSSPTSQLYDVAAVEAVVDAAADAADATVECTPMRVEGETMWYLTAADDALETATRLGFFARPQGATAEEVATTLGTSRSTLMRRLRGAEERVFEHLLGDED